MMIECDGESYPSVDPAFSAPTTMVELDLESSKTGSTEIRTLGPHGTRFITDSLPSPVLNVY